MCKKFIQKVVFYFFKTLSNFFEDFRIFFQFFSECYPGFFNFYISAKFLQSSLKTMAKFFRIPKFYRKLRYTNFSVPTFLHSFFKIFSQLIIIRSYTIMSAKYFQKKWKFSQNFIKIFQRPHQLISKCLRNFLKVFAKLPQGRAERIIQWRRGPGTLKIPIESMNY